MDRSRLPAHVEWENKGNGKPSLCRVIYSDGTRSPDLKNLQEFVTEVERARRENRVTARELAYLLKIQTKRLSREMEKEGASGCESVSKPNEIAELLVFGIHEFVSTDTDEDDENEYAVS